MPTPYLTPTLVMTIERPFFAAIVAQPRRKTVEYRLLGPFWLNRLKNVGKAPFNLRLINGMSHPIPEWRDASAELNALPLAAEAWSAR
jgi:hypothetical protein